MTPAAVIALFAPLLAAPAYELDLFERTELRLRTPGDALDAEQSAGARLSLSVPRARFSFGYSPRLSFSDVFYDPTVDLLHTGELGADFDWRRVRLSLAERGAYGTRTFTSLTPNTYDVIFTDTGNRIVPITDSVDYGSLDSTATLTLELSRRSDLDLAGGYLLDGGLNDRSKRVMPFVYGPRGRVEWRYQVARRDTLGSALEGESLHTDTASAGEPLRADVVRARERWSHRWSPTTDTELSAGAAYAQRSPTTDDPEWLPIGGGSLQHTLKTGPGERLELGTRGQVEVVIDRLTGVPAHRLDLNLEGTWTRDPYALYGSLGRTQSLRPLEDNALVLYSGEVGARYQWTRPLSLEGGFRGAYQTVESPTTTAAAAAADGFNWLVFVALQATAETIRF